ncbi:alpha/beta hydrolase [Formosa sp. 4Alg 33]|uniref:alpha/beta hydrolase n=1 Tax=Formosa sp. 4Alg 33 TaxID=3382189 RepID=UPI003D9C0D78
MIKKNLYKCYYSFVLLFGVSIMSSLYSQSSKIVSFWDTEIPNAISNVTYKELPIYKDGVLSSTSKVSLPTLTIYSPKQNKANGVAVVVCPGGGYNHLAMDKEGAKVGKWLSALGITVFVLKYRLPNDAIMEDKTIGPLQDAQEAMRYVRRHSEEYKLDLNKIGVLGFSAGGHLASTLSTRYNETVYVSDKISAKPDFSILIYPVISMQKEIAHNGSKTNLLGASPSAESILKFSNELNVDKNTPITFLVYATDDSSVPVENSINYYLALKNNNVPVEMHVFEKGGHGLGLVKDGAYLPWKIDCENWLKSNGFILQ